MLLAARSASGIDSIAIAIAHALLAEEESMLLHEAFEIVLGRVAGFELIELRQKLILERGVGSGHRLYVETDRRLLRDAVERESGEAPVTSKTRFIAKHSRRERRSDTRN